jgi:hypothetical protein
MASPRSVPLSDGHNQRRVLAIMKTIFAMASARTGTKYLTAVFRENAVDCTCKHEAMPTLFGPPVLWRTREDWDRLRQRFAWKRWRIAHCGTSVYVETSHAFLKSFSELALEAFPDLKLIHVYRDPIKAAKSEMNRQHFGDRYFVPFRYHPGTQGQRIFRFALSGEEQIFRDVRLERPSELQWYLLQWIEIENRAMRFLKENEKSKDCFSLAHPRDINDPAIIAQMFHFFELQVRHGKVILPGAKNQSQRPTEVTDEDRAGLAEVVDALPSEYLDIFRNAPYAGQPWAESLVKA